MERPGKPRGGHSRLEPAIIITRGRIDKLTLHEVSDGELDAIEAAAERGAAENSSIFLNFAVGLLTLFVSLLLSLLVTRIEDPKVFLAYVAVTFSSGIGGVILLILWWRAYKASSKQRTKVAQLIRTIRDRLPPQGIQEPLPAPPAQLESPDARE